MATTAFMETLKRADAKSIEAAKAGERSAKARDPFDLLIKTINIDTGIKTNVSNRCQLVERHAYNELRIATEAHSPK